MPSTTSQVDTTLFTPPTDDQAIEPSSSGSSSMPEGDGARPTADRASRAQKKAQSRRQILDAARDVFFRDGFMAANLDEVAEKAGVAKGTLYRYFESKADLYVAVLADNGDRFTQKMKEEADSPDTPGVAVLQNISRFYFDYWTRHPEYFQIFWAIDNQAVIGDLPQSVVEEVARLWGESLRVVDGVLARAVSESHLVECDTWEVANILWTTANALIQANFTRPRRELRRLPLDRVYHDAIRYILLGLATPDSPLLGAAGESPSA
jgi:AcrR family transcriptional regulator